ncbi:MAG: ATP-binding protein [Planctomycetota bacterium]|nr:MAG: ATP-binding protein [Planctomycetota bacterium]
MARITMGLPVLTLMGPRQSGKTTLARTHFSHLPYVSLENPDQRRAVELDPRGFLAAHPEGAVIDEVQRVPQLLSYLQEVVDLRPHPGRWVLTGSHNLMLMESVSQSLAGRSGLLTLLPFSLAELQALRPLSSTDQLLWQGGYPRIHTQGVDPLVHHRSYYQTFVERDLRSLLKIHDLSRFDTFVRLCAGRVGQLLNIASLANDAAISPSTAREWLGLLEAAYVLIRVPPWHANIGKRLVKSPKLYFIDVGLACYLLDIEEPGHLHNHPLRGNLFENLVIIEALKNRLNRGLEGRLHFFRSASGDEVDLLFPQGPALTPIEIKSGATMHTGWLNNIDKWRKISGSKHGGLVIYNGDQVMPYHIDHGMGLQGFLGWLDKQGRA